MKIVLKLIVFILAFSAVKATELVHFTLENRQVNSGDYYVDLYAEPSGTWGVGITNIAIIFNSSGLSATEYNGDDLFNLDSELQSAGYDHSQMKAGSERVIVSLYKESPYVDKTSKFRIGTFRLKIIDDTEYDNLSFDGDESEAYNSSTELTYGCSLSTCWDANDPTSQVIGQETSLDSPTLSSPANNATDISTSPTLSWNSVSGATSYDVQVSTSNDFSTLIVNENVSSTSKSVSGLNNETTYLWRARAKNASETSDWSSVWTFETEASGGGYGELVHFTLENRQVNSGDYYVDLYAEPSGTWGVGITNIAIIFNSSGLSATEYNGDDLFNLDSELQSAGYDHSQMKAGSERVIVSLYKESPYVDKTSKFRIGTFRLKIIDDTEYDNLSFDGDESEAYNSSTELTYGCSLSTCWDANDPTSKVIGEEASLSAPTLSSPANNATDISTSPTLSWNSVSGATSYDLQVSTSNDFSTLIVNENVSSTSKSVSGLNNETTYLWRARAKNASETSDWSSVWSFETEASGGGMHFSFNTTNRLMTLKIAANTNLLLDGVQIATGDEIGVFTQDDVCVGAIEWEGSQVFFNVYGKTTTPPVDGLESGEELVYKFWDVSAGQEFKVSEVGHSDLFGNPINGEFDTSVPYKVIDSLIAISSFTQTLNFTSGWNLFSSYIEAQYSNLDSVMNDVSSNLIIMRNDNGGIFVPLSFNTIGNWNNHDGYEGYFNSSTSLDIEGTKLIPENEDISLNTGWSFIGYLRDSDLNIATALNTINSNLVIARDGASGIYVPGGFNTIGNMEPGKGYQVYLSVTDILTYPANGSGKLGDYSDQITAKPEYLKLKEAGTGHSFVLFIEDLLLPNGIEIGAFSKEGELFGSGIVFNKQTVLVIHGDNEITEFKDGFKNNEEIIIKAFDPENSQYTEMNLTEIITFENEKINTLRFMQNAIVYAKEGKSVETYFASNRLIISPNPVSEISNLNLSLKESSSVSIEIYAASGQKLHTINNGTMTRGIHDIQLNFADYVSGMYTITVKLDNEVLSTNVIKVK